MKGKIRRIIRIFHKELLLTEVFSVPARHKNSVRFPAGIDIIVIFPVLQLHISGIVQIHFPVLEKCASGVNSAAVKGLIRIQVHALILPVDHVPAGVMSPHLHSAFAVKGGILEKCVEHALKLTQTIGIIEPSRRRHQMQFLPVSGLRPRIFFHFFLKCFFRRLSQFFQIIRQCAHNTLSCLLRPGRKLPLSGPQHLHIFLSTYDDFILRSP